MGTYRPNVAALIINEEGRLLICERLATPGAWQFPQGGVDGDEDAESALIREVREEVGLQAQHYRIEDSKGGYRYDYPADVLAGRPPHKAHFAGQEQTYFLCRLLSEAPSVDLTQEPREFSQARWIAPSDFQLAWLPEFKKGTYCAVFRDFFGVDLSA